MIGGGPSGPLPIISRQTSIAPRQPTTRCHRRFRQVKLANNGLRKIPSVGSDSKHRQWTVPLSVAKGADVRSLVGDFSTNAVGVQTLETAGIEVIIRDLN